MDPDKGFVLRTDASDYAVGAVLEKIRDDGSHVPVAFWSRILAEGQRRTWTAREKETYAIVCALRKWSGHIGLQPVVVCTDHQSLQSWHEEHVDTPSGPAARRAGWHETFAKFDLSVVYVPGKDNTVADCLSRWAYPAGKAWMDISSHEKGGEAGSDPRGHLGVTWGVYLCAGKPPLADIILSHPPDLTRCDSVIGLAIPAMSGHIQYRGAASGDLYIRISGINRVYLS